MKKIFAAIAVLAVVALAAPVMAAADAPGYGVTMGGRVKVSTGWQVLGGKDDTVMHSNNTDSTIVNYFISVDSNSYLRASFTSADKTTGALIEIGFLGSTNRENSAAIAQNNDNLVYLRHAYGWWKVGTCKLLVGQFAGRLGDAVADQTLGVWKSGKSGLGGFGFLGGTRNPKVALQMDVNDNFGFEVAIGQAGNENTFPGTDFAAGGVGLASTNSWLPRLEAVLDFKFGDWKISLGGGIAYQSWKSDALALNDVDDNALSWVVWLPVRYNNGPFSALLAGYYGQNVDTDWTGEGSGATTYGYCRAFGNQLALPRYNANGDLENSTSWGVGLNLGWDFTQQLGIRVGGGLTQVSNDAWDLPQNNDSYMRWAAYVALPYKLTSNFTIQPEVGYYNYGDTVSNTVVGTDGFNNGDEWLVGVHFQFLF